MPKETLFKAAMCSQCGAPLDASKLHCSSCNTDYVLDWGSVVIEAVPQSTRFRDRAVDAVLIAALQREAVSQDVEVALTLKRGQNENHLMVLVKDKKFGKWEEVGCFTGFATNDGFDYHISGGGDHYNGTFKSYWLEWDGEYGHGNNRFYQLREDSRARMYSDHQDNYRGEQELFNAGHIRWLMRAIVGQAYRWIEFEREQEARAAEEEARRRKNPFRRLLGL